MVLIQFHRGKLLRRAAFLGFCGLLAFGSFIGALLGLLLLVFAVRIVTKALSSDLAAVVQHAKGLEVRTLWKRNFISYDDYRGLKTETLFFSLLGLPIPGPVNLIVRHGAAGRRERKLRLPLGVVKLPERLVPEFGSVIETFAVAHREAGATWHKAWNEKAARENYAPPPREFGRRAAPRRDPLEGHVATDLTGHRA